jgi:hypothetical protein
MKEEKQRSMKEESEREKEEERKQKSHENDTKEQHTLWFLLEKYAISNLWARSGTSDELSKKKYTQKKRASSGRDNEMHIK